MDVSLGASMLSSILRSQQNFVDPETKASFAGFKKAFQQPRDCAHHGAYTLRAWPQVHLYIHMNNYIHAHTDTYMHVHIGTHEQR